MFRAAWEERVTIIKPTEDKGGHKCFCRVNWKKMPNCANTAEFRVGRSADVLHVKFHAHVTSDVKTKISGGRRKRYFTATDRDGSRFGDWKGLRRWEQEDGLCFIIVKLSLFSSIQVWMSDRQVSREDIADWIFDGGTETWSWVSSAKEWDSIEWHWMKSEIGFV